MAESAKPTIDAIREKFGDDYVADANTFIMGIDSRFTSHFAERFGGLLVLETCTGAGFTTIALAKTAKHVITVELDPCHQEQAIQNVQKTGLPSKVSFRLGSILDEDVLKGLPSVDAAFIDPDWAVTGPGHVYRFRNANTKPPADVLLHRILEITPNVALVLPPFIPILELEGLLEHECERLYLGTSHELLCLYFGKLMRYSGETKFCCA